jgi:hypothetical protein
VKGGRGAGFALRGSLPPSERKGAGKRKRHLGKTGQRQQHIHTSGLSRHRKLQEAEIGVLKGQHRACRSGAMSRLVSFWLTGTQHTERAF